MLWRKEWLETRTRFTIALAGITGLCALRVYQLDQLAGPETRLSYYYMALHGAHFLLCLMWIVAVTLLTMGGLLREKSVGAAAFTLSLPVSRRRLMGARIGVTLLEALALAVVPWVAMYAAGAWSGKATSAGEAVYYVGLLAGGGLVFYGLALLASSTIEGEYAAPLASLGLVFAIGILGDGALRPYNPLAFIQAGQFVDKQSMQLAAPFPWVRLAVTVVVAAVLMAASVKAVDRREF